MSRDYNLFGINNMYFTNCFMNWVKLCVFSKCFFFLYLFYLFKIFGCIRPSLWHAGSFVEARGLLSSCATWAPECVDSVVCGTQSLSLRRVGSVVAGHGLSCPTACGILVSRPGIKAASPALEGRFFTTGALGKSLKVLLNPL